MNGAGAKVRYNAYYGQGKGPIYGYSCNGREDSLFSCSRLSYYSISRCSHYEDVAVECEGEAVLLNHGI